MPCPRRCLALAVALAFLVVIPEGDLLLFPPSIHASANAPGRSSQEQTDSQRNRLYLRDTIPMASTTLIPVSEYLATTYRHDCDYIDGEVVERET